MDYKKDLIDHLKIVQHDLQTKQGYSEVNGHNDLVDYYNKYFAKNYDKDIKELNDDFYHLVLIFRSISSHSQQGHWKSVMSTQIGWMLSRYDL